MHSWNFSLKTFGYPNQKKKSQITKIELYSASWDQPTISENSETTQDTQGEKKRPRVLNPDMSP